MSFSHSNILHADFEHERVDIDEHSEEDYYARNRDHKIDDQNALAGVIIGFFTILLTGAAAGLSWYLYWYHGSVPWLTNSIFITVAFIAAIFGIINCFVIRSNNVSDGAGLMGTMLCIIAATYCLTAGFTMYLYRYWEYSWSLMAFANSDLKEIVFGSGTFASVWSLHKTLINSMCVLLLVACIGLLWLAYVQWASSAHRLKMARYTLYFLIVCVMTATMMGFYYIKVAENYMALKNIPEIVSGTYITSLKVIFFIGLAFSLLNLLANLFRWRSLYFLIGMLSIGLVFCSVISNGMVFRSIRVHQSSPDLASSCNEMQRTLAESELTKAGMDQWCKTKYLPLATKCEKINNALFWEKYIKDAEKTWTTRSLDGSCCRQAASFMLYPFFCLAWCTFCWSVLMVLMIGANFYLSDTTEQLVNFDKKTSGCDWLTVFLCLALLGCIIALMFHKVPAPVTNPYVSSYNSFTTKNLNDANFTPVPSSVLKKATVTNDLCYSWSTKSLPLVKLDPAVTGGTQGFRVAILAKNSTLKYGAVSQKSQVGPTASRVVFWPGQNNSADAALFIYGLADEVNTLLKTVKVCPIDLNMAEKYWVDIQQVDQQTLNSQGLTSGQDLTGYEEPTANGASPTPSGTWPQPMSFSSGSYKASSSLNVSLPIVVVQGTLKTKVSNGGAEVTYTGGNVSVKCFRGNFVLNTS
jgi:hypothetical protein